MEFNVPQYKAYSSETTETFLIGGYGLGKSFFLAFALLQALTHRNAVCALYAPTVKMLNNSTYKQVTKAWAEHMGFIDGVHYVMGRRPPKQWGVPPFSGISSHKVLTTAMGSYCITDGLENYDSQRGSEFDVICVDEFREVDEAARIVLTARLRGKTFENLGLKHRIYYATTPPDNPIYLQKLMLSNNPDVSFVFGTSYENEHNLPKDYIARQRQAMDDVQFRREILAELTMNGNSLFAYAFDYSRHVIECQPNYEAPAVVSFDFNVNPMTCIIAQNRGGIVYVVGEFRKDNTNLEVFLRHIYSEVKKYKHIQVTGDPAGRSRSIYTSENMGAYIFIQKSLRLNLNQIRVMASSPTHYYSRIFCNSLFTQGRVMIGHQCEHLINDLRLVSVDNEGKIDKKQAELTHQLDCLRYYLHTFIPATEFKPLTD